MKLERLLLLLFREQIQRMCAWALYIWVKGYQMCPEDFDSRAITPGCYAREMSQYLVTWMDQHYGIER